MEESAMTFINSHEAIEGYADGKKKYVIRFD